jgi:integrase
MSKPDKPSPDFPLFAHANGQWAKKIKGKLHYFGPWADPDGALERYLASPEPESLPVAKKTSKPAKPHPDFPLYAHASGKWAKTIDGKTYYFGKWDDPQGALQEYLDTRDDILAGCAPSNGHLTVRDLANRFVHSKRDLLDNGELEDRTWQDYHDTAKRVVDYFGPNKAVDDLKPDDFGAYRKHLATSRGVTALGNEITRVRSMFKYACENGLIDRPVRYGTRFKKPSRKTMRRHRAKRPPRKFEAHDLRQVIDAAGVQMRAMIYLGINCGLGNTECMLLTIDRIDLEKAWLDYPRPKTGAPRECPLWPETVEALLAALAARPRPKRKEHQDLVFITKYGNSWEPKAKIDNPVSREMTEVIRKAKVYRPGYNFYALRHTCKTIGARARDKDAVDYIMGWAEDPSDMSHVYNEERPSDERLRDVTEYIRDWLRNTPAPSMDADADDVTQAAESVAPE